MMSRDDRQSLHIKELVAYHSAQASSHCTTISTPFNKAFRELSEIHNLFDRNVKVNSIAVIKARKNIV